MIKIEVNEETGIALIEPTGSLTPSDFEVVRSVVDPYLEKVGPLAGIIIHTEKFPGWSSFEALYDHLYFIHDHHKKVKKVALVSNSKIVNFVETMAKHFVEAEIKMFSYEEIEEAIAWMA